MPNPVYAVICGAFMGSGSETMVVSLASGGTSVPFEGWAVFRLDAGTWRLVMRQNNGAQVTAAGNDIRETRGVNRPGDPRCCPSGGTRARIWRWDGKRLVASPWKQVKPATAPTPNPSTFKSGWLKTPSGNIQCVYGYQGTLDPDAFVVCGIKSGLRPPPKSRGPGCQVPNRVALKATGRGSLAGPSACPGEDEGDCGPFCGGQPGGPPIAVLGYGTTWSGGGLRCISALTGLTCRNMSGHGFFMSRERWRAF